MKEGEVGKMSIDKVVGCRLQRWKGGCTRKMQMEEGRCMDGGREKRDRRLKCE